MLKLIHQMKGGYSTIMKDVLKLLDYGNKEVKIVLTNDFIYAYTYDLDESDMQELEDAFKLGMLKKDVDDSVIIPKGLECTFKVSEKYISKNTGKTAYSTVLEYNGVTLEVMPDYMEATVIEE